MRAEIIRIGNSQGIRFPKAVMSQCGFGKEVDIHVEDHKLIIEGVKNPREGWGESFKKMAKNKEDRIEGFSETIENGVDWIW